MNFNKFVCIIRDNWKYSNFFPACRLQSHHHLLKACCKANITEVARSITGTHCLTARGSRLGTTNFRDTNQLLIANGDIEPHAIFVDPSTTATISTREEKVVPVDDDNDYTLPSQKEKEKLSALLEEISSAQDDKIFYLYSQNKTLFKINHYVKTIKRISELYKNGVISSSNLLQRPEFGSICYDLWKLMSLIEADEVLALYKYLQDMKINDTFLIMQSLLQMMRHQINLHDPKNLVFLQRLLDKTKPCKLKTALEAAIPKVLETHFKVYISKSFTPYEVVKLLKICSRGRLEETGLLLRHIHGYHLPKWLSDVSVQSRTLNLLSLIKHLVLIPPDILNELETHTFNRLLKKCLDEIMETGFSVLTKKQILGMMQALSDAYVDDMNNVTGDEFLTALSNHCLSQNWDLDALLRIASLQLSMHFVSDDLVSCIVQTLNQGSTSLDHLPKVSILPLISAIASSNIPLVESQQVVRSFLSQYDFSSIDKRPEIPWIRIALNLVSLQIFPENLLIKILNEDFLKRCLEIKFFAKHDLLDLHRLNRALKLQSKETSLTVPVKFLNLLEIKNETAPSLTHQLKSLITDEGCLASNVLLPSGTIIDHLLVLDEAGNALNLHHDGTKEDTLIAISSLKNTSSQNRIAVMGVPESWMYNPGKRRLRGSFRLELELISREGFRVLPLYEREINDLQPESVLDYLKDQLRQVGMRV